MRISWLKLDNDNKNFRIPANLGMDVFSVNSTENVDNKIDELIERNYNTIIVSNDVAGLSEKINKEYLYHLFQSEKFVKDCKNSGKGVAQQNISTEWLKEYIVPLPPLLEQDRIVTLIKGIYSYLDTIMESL